MTPDAMDPKLLDVLDLLASARVTVRVFGGFAVGVDPRSSEIEDEAALRAPHDPLRLATLIRSTGDVDIAVVGSLERAERLLASHGYTKVPRPAQPPSSWRGPLTIDLVSADPASSSELERLLAFLVARPDGAEPEGIPVFAPGDLVVLKSVAYCDRLERRDLADVGRIALLDQVSEPTARDRLVALAAALPPFASRALLQMRERFGDEGAVGPAAFLEHTETHVPGLRLDEDRELDVRAAVAKAVRDMIDPALARI